MEANLNSFYLLFFGLLNTGMLGGLIFYLVGHIRTKNINSLLAQTLISSAAVILLFLLFGQHFFHTANLFTPELNPKQLQANYSPFAALFFQLTLPAISICIIAGCVAERVKFSAVLFFGLINCLGIFGPLYCWVWGNGFLHRLGFIDAAGAGVVYLAAAIAGLTGTIIIGPRADKYHGHKTRVLQASNIPLVMQGLLLFFIGSFGFNSGVHIWGSDIHSMATIAQIMINTICCASAGLVAALLITRIFYGAIDLTFIANGLIAGTCAIAADPIHATLWSASLLGMLAAFFSIISITLLEKLRIDDPAGIIGSFGASSFCGLISVGLAHPNSVHQILIQNLGVFVIIAWVALTSSVAWLTIRYAIGLRIKAEDEIRGLDVLECGMTAYAEFSKSPE